MTARFTITSEGNYIKVLSNGDKNFEYSQRLWQAVKDATYFIDTVLFNRGLPGRLFDTALEATEWLLAVDDN